MLDFKGWEKIAEDKKTTTLKHAKGHVMTLAHSKLPKIQQEALKRLKLADGTPDGTVGDSDQKAPVTVNVNPPQMPAPVQSAQPVPVQQPALPPDQNVLLPNGSMNAPAAARAGQEAAQLGSQIEAAKSQAAVPQLQQSLNQQQNLNQYDAAKINELDQHAKDLHDYAQQNPLKENAYLENMGAGKKIGTALGLVLSGAGSGLTGGPNLAYDFLNKQIDRNIQAQKDRFGQQNTIWSAYKDMYGQDQIASNMARVHQLDMLNTQAQQTAAMLGTPTAKANLLKLQSQLAPERNKLILDSAGSLNSIPMNVPKGGGAQPQGTPQPSVQPGQAEPQASNQSGMPQANASIPQKTKEDYYENHILNPGAQNLITNQLPRTPIAKDQLPEIQRQYNQAVQAEKGLKNIDDTYSRLSQAANKSGGLGNLRRNFGHDLQGLPLGIGNVVGAPLNYLTDTPSNRTYDSEKTSLLGYVSSALKGTNIGSGQIQEIVDKNSPEHGDSQETLDRKKKVIKEFIKNHTETSLLKNWGVSRD